MVFSSSEFLFVFLPLFLLVYALLPFKNVSYSLFSLLFYFVGEGYYALIIVGSVIVNYVAGLAIGKASATPQRNLALGIGVVFNLSLLLFFKYASFLWTNVLGNPANAYFQSVHLPLGISFFTFHAV